MCLVDKYKSWTQFLSLTISNPAITECIFVNGLDEFLSRSQWYVLEIHLNCGLPLAALIVTTLSSLYCSHQHLHWVGFEGMCLLFSPILSRDMALSSAYKGWVVLTLQTGFVGLRPNSKNMLPIVVIELIACFMKCHNIKQSLGVEQWKYCYLEKYTMN